VQTRIYSPEPALKRPGEFFRDMWSDIRSSRGLAYQLAKRDFKAMYRQSALGYFWAFFPPLVTTALFLILRSGGSFSTDQDTMPYLPFILIGTLLWQIFADALQGPLKVVTASKGMLVKINFPREAVLLAGVGMSIINFVIRLLILIPALIYFYFRYPEMSAGWGLLLFPFGVLALILVGYTFGVLLVPLGMLFKDIGMALLMVVMFWMFVTPVVFPLAREGSIAVLQLLNPVTPVLVTTRELVLGLPLTMPLHCLIVILGFAALLCLGWILFRVALPHVIARLGM